MLVEEFLDDIEDVSGAALDLRGRDAVCVI